MTLEARTLMGFVVVGHTRPSLAESAWRYNPEAKEWSRSFDHDDRWVVVTEDIVPEEVKHIARVHLENERHPLKREIPPNVPGVGDPGGWWVRSASDPRWNGSGDARGYLAATGVPGSDEWIAAKKAEFGEPPTDLQGEWHKY